MSTEHLDYTWYSKVEMAMSRALREAPGFYLVVHDPPSRMYGVRSAITLEEPSMFTVVRRIVNLKEMRISDAIH